MGPFEQLSVAGRVTPNAMVQRERESTSAQARATAGRVCVVDLPLGASPWSPTHVAAGRPAAAGTESLQFEASLPLLSGELPRTVSTFPIV